MARFEAASIRVGPVSARIGEASGRLEALNRAAIYFRFVLHCPPRPFPEGMGVLDARATKD